MSVYKRILVATDFSDINRLAIERAALLAKQDKCELILLHVIEHFPIDGGPLSSVFQYNTEPVEALSQHVRARMDKLKQSLDYPAVQTEFRITSKSARHEILRFATEHEVDLIVVAPHGQGVIGTLGSTATGVLNNAVCDVLAVRDTSQ
jgi:universal stress protein A